MLEQRKEKQYIFATTCKIYLMMILLSSKYVA
jgi:hypothetical protein